MYDDSDVRVGPVPTTSSCIIIATKFCDVKDKMDKIYELLLYSPSSKKIIILVNDTSDIDLIDHSFKLLGQKTLKFSVCES